MASGIVTIFFLKYTKNAIGGHVDHSDGELLHSTKIHQ